MRRLASLHALHPHLSIARARRRHEHRAQEHYPPARLCLVPFPPAPSRPAAPRPPVREPRRQQSAAGRGAKSSRRAARHYCRTQRLRVGARVAARFAAPLTTVSLPHKAARLRARLRCSTHSTRARDGRSLSCALGPRPCVLSPRPPPRTAHCPLTTEGVLRTGALLSHCMRVRTGHLYSSISTCTRTRTRHTYECYTPQRCQSKMCDALAESASESVNTRGRGSQVPTGLTNNVHK